MYKQMIVKRGNTKIVEAQLEYAEIRLRIYEKSDLEIWDERGKLAIGISLYPKQCLKINQKDYKIENISN